MKKFPFFNKDEEDILPPPVVIQNAQVNEELTKKKLLERMLALDIGLHLLIGGIIIIILIFLVVLKFDLFDFLNKKPKPAPTPTAGQTTGSPMQRVVLAQEASSAPTYIKDQTINIEKTFNTPSDNIKLSMSGSLKKDVVGFLPYWMISKIEDINTTLLTAISYFGLEVDGEGNVIKTDVNGKSIEAWYHFQHNPQFDKFVEKLKKNRVKVYLTLKCFNQDNIVKLSTSPSAQTNFINNALFLMNSKGLDGINLDFEYIGTPDKKVIDGFSLLVINLNKEMKRQYPNSILSVDTFVDAASNTRLHDIPILSQNADSLMIMAYDFHTPNSAKAGPVSPFEGYGNSLNGLMTSYLEKAPAEKLTLIVPYYGYDWPVTEIDKNAQVLGTRLNVKVLSYAEIMDASRKSQINWDENAQTPWYSYSDSATKIKRVVHFENTRSLGVKYDFINNKNLQGVGIWALGFDGKRNDLNQLLSDKFTK